MEGLRTDLPPIPDRMKDLPVHRGYPVPFFVPREGGVPDFRAVDPSRFILCVMGNACWICGGNADGTPVFVLGVPNVIGRTSIEPPCHEECARFAIQTCPHMTNSASTYRQDNMPKGSQYVPGMVMDNIGVHALWHASEWEVVRHSGGILNTLFELTGEPVKIDWYKEGRLATREEVLAAIDSRIQLLLEKDPAVTRKAMEKRRQDLLEFVPQ